MKSICCTFLYVLGAVAVLAQDWGQIPTLSSGNAEQYLVRKVDPEYPTLAKSAKLQGRVVLRVTVSREGKVESAVPISGYPILVQAATEAIRKWEYRPLMADGRPSGFVTTVEIPFSLDNSPFPAHKFDPASANYSREAGRCREQLQRRNYVEAEKLCIPLIEIAEKLPPDEKSDRYDAYRLVGLLYSFEGKPKESLPYYFDALTIAESGAHPIYYDRVSLYRHIVDGLQATGDLQKAQMYYEKALDTLERERENELGDQRTKLSNEIQSLLRDYAALLRKAGKEEAAEAAEKRAESLGH